MTERATLATERAPEPPATASRTREEITAICQEFGVAAAPLRDVQEVLNDRHLHARGFLSYHDTGSGQIALPNSPMRHEGSDLQPLVPAPQLGEHTGEVLRQLCGLGATRLAELRAEGAIG